MESTVGIVDMLVTGDHDPGRAPRIVGADAIAPMPKPGAMVSTCWT